MEAKPTRPSLAHAGTTLINTLPAVSQDKTSKAEASDTTDDPHKSEGDVESVAQGPTTSNQANETSKAGTSPNTVVVEASSLTTLHDAIVLAGIFVMLVWPWIFFGVVWQKEGLEMDTRAARVVTDHPQATSFFVTLIGNLICLIVGILFSIAIIRFAQEWVADRTLNKKEVTVFHVSLLTAFRHRSWPWKVADLKHLFVQQRWLPVALVGACIATFAFVPSSTTSLIGPVIFNRTVDLLGTELDFASGNPECVNWFNSNANPNNCDWKDFKGLAYTTCLGQNQLVDVLESGRGNILSLLSNNTESLALSQLGGQDGLHFLGPIRGVLPMGPKGVPAFDTVSPTLVRERPFNYTLDHQGLVSNVSCRYDQQQNPIKVSAIAGASTYALKYNGACPDGTTDFLNARQVVEFMAPNGNNSLVFWACKSQPSANQEPSYAIYMRGRGGYAASIGDITCDVSPIQPAIYPLTYQSKPGVFSVGERKTVSKTTVPEIIEAAVMSVGTVIQELQSFQSNQVAESVITFGVKSFQLKSREKADKYLRLYEAMIQGILEYEVTYYRLIYSTIANPPSSCIRTVNGTFSYETVGWEATSDNIGFLLPMTLVNLISLVVIVFAIIMTRPGARDHDFDPTDPNSLILARHELVDTVDQNEWYDNVTYRPRQAIQMLRKSATDVLTPDVEKSADTAMSIVSA